MTSKTEWCRQCNNARTKEEMTSYEVVFIRCGRPFHTTRRMCVYCKDAAIERKQKAKEQASACS